MYTDASTTYRQTMLKADMPDRPINLVIFVCSVIVTAHGLVKNQPREIV